MSKLRNDIIFKKREEVKEDERGVTREVKKMLPLDQFHKSSKSNIYVPDRFTVQYLIFTGMYTFKASSKEPQNCACLCMHHWLDLHVCLSGQCL